jgi:uncharacterized C2H2 Zn-finger protein
MRQCPKCELRFRSDKELDSHLITDHGVDPDQLPERPPTIGPS